MKTIGIICLLCNLLLIGKKLITFNNNFVKKNIELKFLFENLVNSRRECVHKDFGNGATVCVCNSTYCDNLDPITKHPKGTVLLYESSKSGDRFKESQLKFNGTQQNNATKSQTITIDVNKKFQKIIGFGGAFTDSSGINIASLPQAMQNTLIEDYFSETGIEYTVGRVPIAGTDFSTHAYSYDDNENDVNLTKFALTKDDFEHKVRQFSYKISA
jgi:glucosylceramidase